MAKPRGSAHAPAAGASPRGAKMNDEQKVICKKKGNYSVDSTPTHTRLRVPRGDTAFLQPECAVVSEQESIMEETIGNAADRLFSHARRGADVIYSLKDI